VDKVVVSVADDGVANLPAVVSALRDAGMVVEQVLEGLGVVTGSVAPGVGDRLGAVPGVAHVEVDRTVRLPPDV
jgi:imidazoleglycerol phosphate synthase glutamine amidotransferase subunit HisH